MLLSTETSGWKRLQKNPEAFGSTFEKENAQPLSWFETALGRTDIFGGFLDGTLAGVAGYAAHGRFEAGA